MKNLSLARRKEIAAKAVATRQRNAAAAAKSGNVLNMPTRSKPSSGGSSRVVVRTDARVVETLEKILAGVILGLEKMGVDTASLKPAPEPEPVVEPKVDPKTVLGEIATLAKRLGIDLSGAKPVEKIDQPTLPGVETK